MAYVHLKEIKRGWVEWLLLWLTFGLGLVVPAVYLLGFIALTLGQLIAIWAIATIAALWVILEWLRLIFMEVNTLAFYAGILLKDEDREEHVVSSHNLKAMRRTVRQALGVQDCGE